MLVIADIIQVVIYMGARIWNAFSLAIVVLKLHCSALASWHLLLMASLSARFSGSVVSSPGNCFWASSMV